MATEFLSRRMDLIHTATLLLNTLAMDTSYPIKLSGLVYKIFIADDKYIVNGSYTIVDANGKSVISIAPGGAYDFGGNKLNKETIDKYYSGKVNNVYAKGDKVHCIIDFTNIKIYLCSDTMYQRFISHTTDDSGDGLFRIYEYDPSISGSRDEAISKALTWNSIDDSHDSFIRNGSTYDLYQVIDKDNIIEVGGEETFKLFDSLSTSLESEGVKEAISHEKESTDNKAFIRDDNTRQLYQLNYQTNEGKSVTSVIPVAECSTEPINGFQYQLTELFYPFVSNSAGGGGYDNVESILDVGMIYADINDTFVEDYCFSYDDIMGNNSTLSSTCLFNAKAPQQETILFRYVNNLDESDRPNYAYTVVEHQGSGDWTFMYMQYIYIPIDISDSDNTNLKYYTVKTFDTNYSLNFANTPYSENCSYYVGSWYSNEAYYQHAYAYVDYSTQGGDDKVYFYESGDNETSFTPTIESHFNGEKYPGIEKGVYQIGNCRIQDDTDEAKELSVKNVLKFYSNYEWNYDVEEGIVADNDGNDYYIEGSGTNPLNFEYSQYNSIKALKLDTLDKVPYNNNIHITPFACYYKGHDTLINNYIVGLDPSKTLFALGGNAPSLDFDPKVYDITTAMRLNYYDMMSTMNSKFGIIKIDVKEGGTDIVIDNDLTYVSGLTLADRISSLPKNTDECPLTFKKDGDATGNLYIFSAHNKMVPRIRYDVDYKCYSDSNVTDMKVNSQLTRHEVFTHSELDGGYSFSISEKSNGELQITLQFSTTTNTYDLYLYNNDVEPSDEILGLAPATVDRSVELMNGFNSLTEDSTGTKGTNMVEYYYISKDNRVHRINLYFNNSYGDDLQSIYPEQFRSFLTDSNYIAIYTHDMLGIFLRAQLLYELNATDEKTKILKNSADNPLVKYISDTTGFEMISSAGVVSETGLKIIQNVLKQYKMYPKYYNGLYSADNKLPYYRAGDSRLYYYYETTTDTSGKEVKTLKSDVIYSKSYLCLYDLYCEVNEVEAHPFGNRKDKKVHISSLLDSKAVESDSFAPTLSENSEYTLKNYIKYLKTKTVNDLFATTLHYFDYKNNFLSESNELVINTLERCYNKDLNNYHFLYDFMFSNMMMIDKAYDLSIYDLYMYIIKYGSNYTYKDIALLKTKTIKSVPNYERRLINTTDYRNYFKDSNGKDVQLKGDKQLGKNIVSTTLFARNYLEDITKEGEGRDYTDLDYYLDEGIQTSNVTTGLKSISTISLNDSNGVPYSLLGNDAEKITSDYLNWNTLLNALKNDQSIDLLGDKLREIKNGSDDPSKIYTEDDIKYILGNLLYSDRSTYKDKDTFNYTYNITEQGWESEETVAFVDSGLSESSVNEMISRYKNAKLNYVFTIDTSGLTSDTIIDPTVSVEPTIIRKYYNKDSNDYGYHVNINLSIIDNNTKESFKEYAITFSGEIYY